MTDRGADVEIGARIRAAELRFQSKPGVELGAHPTPEHESERTNLPADIARDSAYENVEVRWRLGARAGRSRQP